MCIRCSWTDNQKWAWDWWTGLSINETKVLAKKYYPAFSPVELMRMHIGWIEDIYNKEEK